jgi:TPR repeat protein
MPGAEPLSSAMAQRATALFRLRERAEQGEAEAQFKIGIAYRMGFGFGPDSAEAARWYRKAAEQGNARAQFHLGIAYRLGDGVDADPLVATEWLTKAASRGHVNARAMLARINDDGMRGVAPPFKSLAKLKPQEVDGLVLDSMPNDPAETIQSPASSAL